VDGGTDSCGATGFTAGLIDAACSLSMGAKINRPFSAGSSADFLNNAHAVAKT
jgi:hypothetical protein